jgi:hypothetical protein
LPVVVNEAATIRQEILTNLALAAANGKARDTLTQDGKFQLSGGWQTLTIFTSNTHLLELSDRVLTEASRRRILELSFDPENCLPLSIGRPINAAIEKNYGIAGRIFLDYVMRHADEVARLVNERVEVLQTNVDSVHRYNVWLIACTSVALEIALALEIIDFEIEDAIANAKATLTSQANRVQSPIERVGEAIAEWTATYNRNIGVKEMKGSNAWHDEPFGEAKGRYNAENGIVFELCLPIKQFKDHALNLGIDVNHIRQYMQSRGAKEQATRLSRHGSGIRCYILPHVIEG